MARDLSTLSDIYDVEKVQLVDMFPQTYHVEAVAKLSLKKNKFIGMGFGCQFVTKKQKSKALINQSNYLPWKGIFDATNMVDIVGLCNEIQFKKRDWRNRKKSRTV